MEQSEQYLQKLQTIRQLPQTSGEEQLQKREQARLLRMETLLDNASLARLLTRTLKDQPITTAEQFSTIAQTSGLVIHPKATEEFIGQLVDTRDKFLQALRIFGGPGIGKKIYDQALPLHEKNRDKEIHGNIILTFTTPLAITLVVQDPEDFERIDPRKNIGGFYRKELLYWYQDTEKKTVYTSVPLIVINGSKWEEDPGQLGVNRIVPVLEVERDKVLLHEKTHAENQVFQDALRKADRTVVWPGQNFDNARECAEYLVQNWNGVESQESDQWHQVLQYALACAKDEVLAAYRTGDIDRKLGALKEREGVYDYFHDDLRIDTQSPLYTEVWSVYQDILDREVKEMAEIRHIYSFFELKDRIDLFPWVLAQIPLDQWKDQLEKTLFKQETDRLKAIQTFPAHVDLSADYRQELHTKKTDIARQLLIDSQELQGKPLFPHIEKAEKAEQSTYDAAVSELIENVNDNLSFMIKRNEDLRKKAFVNDKAIREKEGAMLRDILRRLNQLPKGLRIIFDLKISKDPRFGLEEELRKRLIRAGILSGDSETCRLIVQSPNDPYSLRTVEKARQAIQSVDTFFDPHLTDFSRGVSINSRPVLAINPEGLVVGGVKPYVPYNLLSYCIEGMTVSDDQTLPLSPALTEKGEIVPVVSWSVR